MRIFEKPWRNVRSIILFLWATIFLLTVLFNACSGQQNLSQEEVLPRSSKIGNESKFIKEGKVTFFSKKTKKRIIAIDIEIADTPLERATGLMYRRSIPAKAGMLFIYEQSKPRIFWMENTYIPLDIIFLDEDMRIVMIQKNQKPLSKKLIPSYKNSLYVVEVNAGFCDKYGINIGGYIDFYR